MSYTNTDNGYYNLNLECMSTMHASIRKKIERKTIVHTDIEIERANLTTDICIKNIF